MFRHLLLRHGRAVVPTHTRRFQRSLATEADIDSIRESIDAIEKSLDNTALQTRSLDAEAQRSGVRHVEQINKHTHSTQKLLEDGTDVWLEHDRAQQNLTRHLGSTLSPHYKPHQLITNPPRPTDITLELLLASQAHLGHNTSRWNPANSQYIFGIRQGIHIISLEVTASHLRRACKVVSGVAERGGFILFVGTREGQARCVVRAAELAGGYHLFERWRAGSITNGPVMLRQCRKVAKDQYDRPVEVSEEQLENMPPIKPDLVVCLNPLENWILLHECSLYNIPTIGIIDTNANPTWVTYPIPANDDSLRCVQVIAGALGRAGEEGQALRKEAALQGEVPYTPTKLPKEKEGESAVQNMWAREGFLGEEAQKAALEKRGEKQIEADIADALAQAEEAQRRPDVDAGIIDGVDFPDERSPRV